MVLEARKEKIMDTTLRLTTKARVRGLLTLLVFACAVVIPQSGDCHHDGGSGMSPGGCTTQIWQGPGGTQLCTTCCNVRNPNDCTTWCTPWGGGGK